MPVLLLERLPLPSLEAYAIISVSLLCWSLHYASEKTLDHRWKARFGRLENSTEEGQGSIQTLLSQHWLSSRAQDIFLFSIHDSLCIWIVVNMTYCSLVLFGNWVQKQVFGELRVSELQHIKDKFWNFVFYKFIFIFGIINVQSMEGVILWGGWFSAIGFLHIHSQLCQDRFEYLSMTPGTPRHRHFRLLVLLGSISILSGVLFVICLCVGYKSSWIMFALLAPECLLLTLRTTHTIARYILYLTALQPLAGNQSSPGWNPIAYYLEFAVETSCLALDLTHHIHMLLRANMLLSMASLVIFMQLRVLYAQLSGRLRRHKNYRRLLHLVRSSCPLEELDLEPSDWEDNKCAICWEAATVARRLPCGHTFHHGCLLHWLEQDASCPTCRRQLLPNGIEDLRSSRQQEGGGWTAWSWTGWSRLAQHGNENQVASTAENSQLENLAEQILQMFPDYPIATLIEDLRTTRSVDSTIENILEGRLIPTFPSFQQELSCSNASSLHYQDVAPPEGRKPEFVEDPQERQQLLQSRKRDLVTGARNRFLQRQSLNNSLN